MLPNELIYYISEYDYGIMCALHGNEYPIQPKNCTYDLVEYCVKYDYIDIIKYCCYNRMDTFSEANYENLFEKAIMYDSVNAVQWFYNCQKTVFDDECICEYVIYAIQQKMFDIVYFFVNETNIDLEYDDCKILETAIQIDNPELVRMILDSPNMDYTYGSNNYPLISAIELRRHNILNIMVGHPKVDAHEPDNEPFRVALLHNDKWVVDRLLRDNFVHNTLQLDYDERIMFRELY